MRPSHRFLLFFCVVTLPLFSQKRVALSFDDSDEQRQELINDRAIEFSSAGIYSDEMDLLNDPRFAHVTWLMIKARNFFDSMPPLPESLITFDSLQTFSVEDMTHVNWNRAYTLLAAIPSLKTVSIKFCQPSPFCATLASLEQITALGIDFCSGENIDPVYTLHRLQWLALRSSVDEERLSPKIGELTDLTYLDLGYNSFSSLPPEITNLKKLRTLKLNDCKMRVMDQKIGELTSLQYLDLSGNWMYRLDPAITQLKALKELRLEWNWLTELPDGMEGMDSLIRLDVSFNRIRSLPVGLAGCDALEQLYCWNSHFNENDPVLGVLICSEQMYYKKLQDTVDHFFSKRIPEWFSVFNDSTHMQARQHFRQDVRMDAWEFRADYTATLMEFNNGLYIDEFTRWRERKYPAYVNTKALEVEYDYPVLPFGYRQFSKVKSVLIEREEPWMSSKRLLRPLRKNPVEKLTIQDPYMRKLPHSIRKMKKLESLTLNCPNVKKLPSWLAEMPCLRKLVLINGVMIPDAIKKNRRIQISYL